MNKILCSLLSLSLCSALYGMNENTPASSADNSYQVITLSPERWQEFRALRLYATEESPVGMGVTLADEQKREEEAYKRFLTESAQEESFWAVFAERGGKLIGMAGAMRNKPHLSTMNHVATIMSVYTQPAFRRLGIATALMKTLMNKLERSTITQAQLQVVADPKNTNSLTAIDLYKRLGFKECGTYSNDVRVNGTTYNSVIMEKEVDYPLASSADIEKSFALFD